MASLESVEWEASPLAPVRDRDRELERVARRAYGAVPPFLPYIAHSPATARMTIQAHPWNGRLAHIPIDLADLVFMAVSQDNSCRYCYASVRAQLRIIGLDADRIRRLEQASFSAQADPRERLALEYARTVSRASPAPTLDQRKALARAGWTEEQIAEIAYMAAYAVGANRLTTLLAFPVEPMESPPWWVRLARPLLARVLATRRRSGRPVSLPEEKRSGPFAYVTNALDGSPTGVSMRGSIEGALSWPSTSARCKALILAVVGRGLGSARFEEEAVCLAEAEGLSLATVANVLEHLGAPELDPIEAAVVPFARETIRYTNPAHVQRRARGLLEFVTPEQFVELVGVVSLANHTARLSLALVEAR